MKNLRSLVYVIIIALLVLPSSASAQGRVSTTMESYLTLSRYLQQVQAGEVKQVLALVQDSRFSSSDINAEYRKLLSDNNMKLVAFEITDNLYSTNKEALYLTTLKFLNGAVLQVPFEMRFDEEWKVWITPESLEVNPSTQLKSATVNFTSTDSNSSTYALTNIINWNFTGRSEGYYFYSINTINFTKSSSEKVILNLYQWVDNNNGGVPDIEYSIIEQTWMGDNIWGTVTGTGTYNAKLKTLTMTGIDQDVSNGKLRFKIRVTGTNSTYSGNGAATIQ